MLCCETCCNNLVLAISIIADLCSKEVKDAAGAYFSCVFSGCANLLNQLLLLLLINTSIFAASIHVFPSRCTGTHLDWKLGILPQNY